jgi:GNAT superfamily N-acetyltransferase
MPQPLAIVRLAELAGWQARLGELDPIFFKASATRSFANERARLDFRERWLGRYLARWPELVYVALGPDGEITGYIIGAHQDPAADAVFADIGYWPQIAHLTAQYPAHLHINLAPAARSLGVGTRLIEAFCADARAAGVPGVHLVTGRDSRNRSFYARNGFAEVAGLVWGGTPIVMLAKGL